MEKRKPELSSLWITVRANDLAEQAFNFLSDTRDNRIVENGSKSSQKQCPENNSDNDLYTVRNIEIASLIAQILSGFGAEIAGRDVKR